MELVVRTWNVFHGNAHPPRRVGYLRQMVELVTGDGPDVVCLQELPVWALPRIDDWSGMRRYQAITRPPLWPGPLSKWVTRMHQGFFRSGLSGQANAILVAPRHASTDLGQERISDPSVERRVVHAVRLAGPARVTVANLHATNDFARPDVPRGQALRALAFAECVATPGDVVVLAGDFNVTDPGIAGYSAPSDGIDHVLVRAARAVSVDTWPRERRVQNGAVLSDHPVVEARIELAAA
jgi:endonuclease/exonuclease/phosphatase family metal-dependent hydrolase